MIGAHGIGTISRSNVVTSPRTGERESYTPSRCEEIVRAMAAHINNGLTVAQASRIVFSDENRNFYYVLSRNEEYKRLYYRLIKGKGNPGQRTLTPTERIERLKVYWDLRDSGVKKADAENQSKVWGSDTPNWRKDDNVNDYWVERETHHATLKERINGIRRAQRAETFAKTMAEKGQALTQDTAARIVQSVEAKVPRTSMMVQDGTISSVLPALRMGKAIRRSDSYTCYAMCEGRMTEYKVILGRRQHVGLAYIIGADLLATDWEVMAS